MNIIDLFSGAGGLPFGFYYRKKGLSFVRNNQNHFLFANEFDKNAAQAFSDNYPDIRMVNRDIRKLKSEEIQQIIGNNLVDLIIGGPPCQSYSTVGKRLYDEKAQMFKEYLRIIKVTKPKMFLFENVRGILSMREIFYKKDENGNILYEQIRKKTRTVNQPIVDHYGDLIINKIKKDFSKVDKDLKYKISCKILNASAFGVPENRERVFIVGVKSDIEQDWVYPEPLDSAPISVSQAISDLPLLNEGENIQNYTQNPCNDYQRLMRGSNNTLTQHYCGIYGEKIRTVIQNVGQGEGKNDFNKLVDEGVIEKKYRLTSGYGNTYGRLIENIPSPTITNNLSTPSSLRCIHYSQNRALSPREGARIQSFPDWFNFFGGKDDVTMQIGNAVPPLLSLEISKQIERFLKKEIDHE